MSVLEIAILKGDLGNEQADNFASLYLPLFFFCIYMWLCFYKNDSEVLIAAISFSLNFYEKSEKVSTETK